MQPTLTWSHVQKRVEFVVLRILGVKLPVRFFALVVAGPGVRILTFQRVVSIDNGPFNLAGAEFE